MKNTYKQGDFDKITITKNNQEYYVYMRKCPRKDEYKIACKIRGYGDFVMIVGTIYGASNRAQAIEKLRAKL